MLGPIWKTITLIHRQLIIDYRPSLLSERSSKLIQICPPPPLNWSKSKSTKLKWSWSRNLVFKQYWILRLTQGRFIITLVYATITPALARDAHSLISNDYRIRVLRQIQWQPFIRTHSIARTNYLDLMNFFVTIPACRLQTRKLIFFFFHHKTWRWRVPRQSQRLATILNTSRESKIYVSVAIK